MEVGEGRGVLARRWRNNTGWWVVVVGGGHTANTYGRTDGWTETWDELTKTWRRSADGRRGNNRGGGGSFDLSSVRNGGGQGGRAERRSDSLIFPAAPLIPIFPGKLAPDGKMAGNQ